MKFRLIVSFVGAIVVVIGATLAVFLLRPNIFSSRQPQTSSIIALENAHQGTTDWQIAAKNGATIEIQAYANQTSVANGQKLTFYVSTIREHTIFSVKIYRLGWYGGAGGRLFATQENLIGHAQGYYNSNLHRLINCKSCHVDTTTGLVEANWQPSYTLTIPSTWVTGVYLAKFTDAQGKQTYTPFDVQGNAQATYFVVTSNTTYQAYNQWGGYSLYKSFDNHLDKAAKVSFDRPYDRANGAGDLLLFEIDAIRWLEHQGYDLSYGSSVDVHSDPAQLLNHHAYLSLGHDEYWTKEMRDGVERARDSGVGLAFVGANAAYWQMRFEPDSAGIENRTEVCYKVQTSLKDLSRDPLFGQDNSRVTALWRDPVLARPENALIGIMWSNYTQNPLGFPWRFAPEAESSLLDGTGLQAGQKYGCELVGYEWDRVYDNGATPAGLHILARSDTVNFRNERDFSNTTYYIASSGSMVFATGSIYWAAGLDSYRYSPEKVCNGQVAVIPGMQKLMINVMKTLAVSHVS